MTDEARKLKVRIMRWRGSRNRKWKNKTENGKQIGWEKESEIKEGRSNMNESRGNISSKLGRIVEERARKERRQKERTREGRSRYRK